MNETAQFIGTFDCWDNPGYDADYLRRWMEAGKPLGELPGISGNGPVFNLLMASQKLLMANAVYPGIDRLVISGDTSLPIDSETSYTAAYTTGEAEEFYRSGNGNPYQVAWNITSSSANGTWGSFILVDAGGAMINRALAGVTKTAGTAKLVQFTGSVV
jgi:hypothetical protein